VCVRARARVYDLEVINTPREVVGHAIRVESARFRRCSQKLQKLFCKESISDRR